MIITTRKQSLGQGNIFRSVCQDFCPQGGYLVQGGCGPRGLVLGVPGLGKVVVVLGGVVLGGGPRGVPGPRGCLVWGCLVPGEGVPGPGGVPGLGGPGPGGSGPGGAWWRPPGMATAAGGTHPTGMHSCLYYECLSKGH